MATTIITAAITIHTQVIIILVTGTITGTVTTQTDTSQHGLKWQDWLQEVEATTNIQPTAAIQETPIEAIATTMKETSIAPTERRQTTLVPT